MAISKATTSGSAAATGSTSYGITFTVANSGDILVATLAANLNGVTWTAPTGWTQIGSAVSIGAVLSMAAYWIKASSSGSQNFTWTASGGTGGEVVLTEWKTTNSWPTNPVDASGSASATTSAAVSVSTSGATTNGAGDVFLAFIAHHSTALTYSGVTSGYTADLSGITSANTTSANWYDITTGTGATITFQATLSQAKTWAAFLIALTENAGGGGNSFTQNESDTQSALDSWVLQTNKPQSGAHSGLDAWLNQPQKNLAPDSHSALDSRISQFGKSVPADAQSALDLLLRAFSGLKADTHSGLDGLTKSFTQLHLEGVSLLDTLSKSFFHIFLDAQSGTDSLTHYSAHALLQALSDAQSATDALTRGVSKLRTDAQSATDTFQKEVLHAVVEMFSTTDSTARQSAKALIDSLSETDKLTVGRGVFLTLLASLSQTDILTESNAHAGFKVLAVLSATIASAFGITTTIVPAGNLSTSITLLASAIAASFTLLN